MYSTVLKEIVAFLFGRKYYANIIGTRGVNEYQICSFIFREKKEADKHRNELMKTMSFCYIETISFRSRKEYPGYVIPEKDKRLNQR